MNGMQAGRVTDILAEARNRRGVVRMLGAALVGGVGVATLAGDAEAGRKNKKEDGGRCRSGKVLQRVQVPADGSAVETKPLAKGQSYRLRVSGFILDDEWGMDGEYYFLLADPDDLANVYDACFDGTPVGVEVSGAPFSGWGGYDADHVYERKLTGKGNSLKLRLSDCEYAGNTGSLKVEVLCG